MGACLAVRQRIVANGASLKSQRTALTFILVTVFIDSVGFGIIIPVLPALIAQLTGASVGGAARWGGWLMFVFALLQFFTAPIIGNLSDRYGRRPLLLGSLLAFSIDFLLSGFARTIVWLFIARALAGAFAATFPVASAYVADISNKDNRTHNYGMLGAAWGVGFIIGPVIGGFAGEFGARVPFFVASALAFANTIFGYFTLPESLPVDKRRAFSWARANAFGAFRSLQRLPMIIGLIAGLFFFRLAHDSLPSVWPFFVIEGFGWSQRDIGYSLGFIGLTSALVMGVFTKHIVAHLGERRAVIAGFGVATLAFLGYAFATQGWMLYAALAVGAFGSVANPSLQSLMTHQVADTQQGELQGAIASVTSVTMIIAPLLMTQLFGWFTSPAAAFQFGGAPFFAAAVFTLICMVLCARAMRSLTR
jgi:DHA1 family tetracycline resistance protein-like MFS transporter